MIVRVRQTKVTSIIPVASPNRIQETKEQQDLISFILIASQIPATRQMRPQSDPFILGLVQNKPFHLNG